MNSLRGGIVRRKGLRFAGQLRERLTVDVTRSICRPPKEEGGTWIDRRTTADQRQPFDRIRSRDEPLPTQRPSPISFNVIDRISHSLNPVRKSQEIRVNATTTLQYPRFSLDPSYSDFSPTALSQTQPLVPLVS